MLAGTMAAALAGTGSAAAQAAAPRAAGAGAAAPGTSRAPAAGVTWHALKLRNGWKSASTKSLNYGTPSYAVRNGVVYLRGGIKQPVAGSSIFGRLPAGARPSHTLWLQVLSGATPATIEPGTLRIDPDGVMSAYNGLASAFTSLGMVSFPASAIKVHAVTVEAGWESGKLAFSESGAPAYAVSHGVVYLSGSLVATVSSPPLTAALLPRAARPAHKLFLTVYTYFGTTGTIVITPGGLVEVYGSAANAFTSLDGISYPAASARWHVLHLDSPWKAAPSASGAGNPAYAVINGIVYFTGAAYQPTGDLGILAILPESARARNVVTALTYAGDEDWGVLTPAGRYLIDSRQPFSVVQAFTSLAGRSYPAGS
jgi:hypothetical protein